jgi:pantoate--beta-alanine ligase
MQKVTGIAELKKIVAQWRVQGRSIAFVPTMGNLHAGHIKLVAEAKKKADKVIVSIFVNPTQFGEGEDFESYPRTEQADQEKLKQAFADLLFLPAVFEMYPNSSTTTISVGELATIHCGAHRAGHFDGVATIVSKLFNMVRPDMAMFGAKDFQQLAVIRKMVQDLNIPVVIFAVVTERESDGLAMSSRNGYLTEHQRTVAPKLYQALCQAREKVLLGLLDFQAIEQQQKQDLQQVGFQVDYFSICKADNLQVATENDEQLVILVAAKLGVPRLIDYVSFSKTP